MENDYTISNCMGISRIATEIVESAAVQQTQTNAPSASADTDYGSLSRDNLKNLIANIAYNETMTDYKDSKDPSVIHAFLNLVRNRAGGKNANIATELSRPSQFSSFGKHVKNGIVKDDGFEPWSPSKENGGKEEDELWNTYLAAADEMLDGKTPDVIGNFNLQSNPKKDSKKALETWGKNCKLQVGSHRYGYDPSQDGYIRYSDKRKAANGIQNAKKTAKRRYHVVSKGDTLWGIAKANGTTPERLAAKNGIDKNAILRIGQKIQL